MSYVSKRKLSHQILWFIIISETSVVTFTLFLCYFFLLQFTWSNCWFHTDGYVPCNTHSSEMMVVVAFKALSVICRALSKKMSETTLNAYQWVTMRLVERHTPLRSKVVLHCRCLYLLNLVAHWYTGSCVRLRSWHARVLHQSVTGELGHEKMTATMLLLGLVMTGSGYQSKTFPSPFFI